MIEAGFHPGLLLIVEFPEFLVRDRERKGLDCSGQINTLKT
jgi:hypothetical protein